MAGIGVVDHPHVWLERSDRRECMACEATEPLPAAPEVCSFDGLRHDDFPGPNFVDRCAKCGRLREHGTL
ncbi:hypothetical protein [Nocardiopsis sp. CC223A]|uniref:hypothetical protein n=1 Tax=Nocardiopsis sp. CC223A TaxID=3044051 RepID=UPI00278C4F63|nr:hypothetical protein [Nocardiopsis sp. CC223A]